MKLHWSMFLLANSLVIVSAGALDYLKSQMQHVETSPRPATVVAQPLAAIVAMGRLEPAGKVIHAAAPQAAGHSRLAGLVVRQGEHVKKGQVLAFMDGKAEHEAALAQAAKQLAVAEAELDKTKAAPKKNEIDARQSEVLKLEFQLNNAKKDQARYDALFKEGAVSATELDKRNLGADIAQQELDEARANLSSISEIRPVEIEVARARLESSRASVALAAAQLDLDYVRAPIDGQILKINTQTGEIADTRGILDLGNTNCMYAVAEVYESDAYRLRKGQSATILCDALPGKIHGRVQEIGLQVEKKQTLDIETAGDIDSRIVETRIRIDACDCARISRYTNSHIKVIICTEPGKA